jgi:putative ABC transport system permease protein
MSDLMIELRQALRGLARNPGYCAVALITLALGIGANTAIFSAVDAVLLRALPYPEPGRLVALWTDATKNDMPRQEWTNADAVADWRRGMPSVQSMAAYVGNQPTLTGLGDPEQLLAAAVQHQMFAVLGVQPERGRVLQPEDDVPNGPSVAVVSHDFWQRRLGGADDLSKRGITLDGKPYAVVGVMPPGFSQPLLPNRSVWLPLQAKGNDRGAFYLRALGRLAPGKGVVDAQLEFDRVAAQLALAHPDAQRNLGGYAQPLQEAVSGPVRSQLLALMAATLLVLLIACANLANLMLARASARVREFAVRAALGARRRHLARQLLCESALLGIGGAALGILLAAAGIGMLAGALPDGVVASAPLRIDLRVLGFALLAGLVSALFFGCVPMLAASRPGIATALRSGERGSTVGPMSQRVRGSLVVLNFALALALCAAGGLFFQSLRELAKTDLGFRTERLLTWTLNLPDASYADKPARAAFQRALLERLRGIPGVAQVGLGSTIPLAGDGTDTRLAIEGAPPVPEDQRPRAWFSVVSSQYLEAMGIDLLRGRHFSDADTATSAPVVIVNHAFAKTHFGADEAAIGHRLGSGPEDKRTWWEIVGVAEDVRFFGVEQAQTPAVYLSLGQRPAGFFTVVLRAAVDPDALVPAIRREIGALDPSLAISNLRSMDQLVSDSERGPRMVANLVGGFAALALLLAAVGVYGVIAYAVSLRTREFGVRLALGARRGALIAQVMRSGLVLALYGIAIGTVIALALGRAVQDLLYQVQPHEPVILLSVAGLLGGTALLATLAPALRASRVDPMIALREE